MEVTYQERSEGGKEAIIIVLHTPPRERCGKKNLTAKHGSECYQRQSFGLGPTPS